jgi:predicted AAA+ superfamily ATPase
VVDYQPQKHYYNAGDIREMIDRKITGKIKDALSDSPVVLLHGARQTGKSTLIKNLLETEYNADYITLDDSSFLSAILDNPSGFLEAYGKNLAIDEVQRAPGLFLAIKKIIDKERKPGKFILTGSANALLVPRASESLAGRMEILNLFPFSQNELSGSSFNFVDILFNNQIQISHPKVATDDLLKRIIQGGYPELLTRKTEGRRIAWFNSYITSIMQRDVKEISNIEGLTQLPRLLNLLASRAGSLLNFAELSRSSGIAQTTLKRYLSLLESTFIIYMLPAYSANLSKRLIKTPKPYLCDTGLLNSLIGADEKRYNNTPSLLGSVLENFVIMELRKQISWAKKPMNILYFRTHSGIEVDCIIEQSDGSVVGIEIKATHTPKAEMFDGLRYFASETGEKFINGFLLYNGDKIIPFDKNLFAVPISILWI